MWQQEECSSRKTWHWLLRPFRSRFEDEMSSIVDSEDVIRDEVADALEKYGIQRPTYRLQLLMCPTEEDADGQPSGPEEWILCVALTLKTGEIVKAMSTLEKYLGRRLDRYAIRVRAVYWRVLGA